ncbi:hypothetical protein SUBVAR_04770 [Subdoligranulum variabile DSM 15176]|uniref:Uncharacterized protein n=1 Tax=Subdoligranulum variabile DSM 15176 TaxID=411471 RepID=D1PK50_9FIRM|nr:hypothetical protein SUBVAR_04770 [Subdoligranulum variabile DSM 15176]
MLRIRKRTVKNPQESIKFAGMALCHSGFFVQNAATAPKS